MHSAFMLHTSMFVKRLFVAPRRIAAISRTGAGKTTVAQALGNAIGLPVVHLDRLLWGPGWNQLGAERFEAGHAAAVSGEAWVIDGGYLSSRGWEERRRRAQVIVLVEAGGRSCRPHQIPAAREPLGRRAPPHRPIRWASRPQGG